jgi:hypothetical protein
MEDVHNTHKETTSGWFSAMVSLATRFKRRPAAAPRGLVVTPWSGRSPGGWSA